LDVYVAMVTADEGPTTSPQFLLRAPWAHPTEAREHVERRLPDLLADPEHAGKRIRAMVMPARTRVAWEPGPTGEVFPKEYVRNDFGSCEYAKVQSDGKVTW
jgi:hypothetical protein